MAGLPKCALSFLRSGCLVLDTPSSEPPSSVELWTTARGPGERSLDLLDRLGFSDPLHRWRISTGEAVKRGFVKLPLRIGLPRLRLRPVEVTHDLGNRDDVARIDLGFVFLGAARPWCA